MYIRIKQTNHTLIPITQQLMYLEVLLRNLFTNSFTHKENLSLANESQQKPRIAAKKWSNIFFYKKKDVGFQNVSIIFSEDIFIRYNRIETLHKSIWCKWLASQLSLTI